MPQAQLNCFHCHKAVEVVGSVGFRDECPACGEDTHVCKNCEFYDTSSYNECREPSADRITEKERANYCEYFKPHSAGSGSDDKEREDLMAQAEALFKK